MSPRTAFDSSSPLAGTLEFWTRFERLASLKLSECNAAAGERLWTMDREPSAGLRFVLRWTTVTTNSVECSLDPNTGLVTCRFGGAHNAELPQFRFVPGEEQSLQFAESELSAEEAVVAILENLMDQELPCGATG